jgi:hypothetical protein
LRAARIVSQTHNSRLSARILASTSALIGALSSARFEPALLPKEREHFLKQKLLSMVFYQTSPKFGEHRGIKSRIGEFQTKPSTSSRSSLERNPPPADQTGSLQIASP